MPDPKPKTISTFCVKFRVPYAAVSIYDDPDTDRHHDGETLDHDTRKRFKYNKRLSQDRYDDWLDSFRDAVVRAMPSMKPCDIRPTPAEHVVLANKLFRVSILDEGSMFAIALVSQGTGNTGAKTSLFPKSCRILRSVLLRSAVADAIIVKRSQVKSTPLKYISEDDMDAICATARTRITKDKDGRRGRKQIEKEETVSC